MVAANALSKDYLSYDVPGMMTVLHVTGACTYLEEARQTVRHEDVLTKIEAAANRFAAVGSGKDYMNQFIR